MPTVVVVGVDLGLQSLRQHAQRLPTRDSNGESHHSLLGLQDLYHLSCRAGWLWGKWPMHAYQKNRRYRSIANSNDDTGTPISSGCTLWAPVCLWAPELSLLGQQSVHHSFNLAFTTTC